MRRLALAVLLLLPSAVASADPALLTLDIPDPEGDVRGFSGARVHRPSADILNFSSRLVGEEVRIVVRVAAPPVAPNDSIEMRIWLEDSVNGSFDALDLAVYGAMAPEARLESLLRRDRYENVTYIPASYRIVDRASWTFSLSASWVQDAECFDPVVNTNSMPKPREGEQGLDQLERNDGSGCVRGGEPEWTMADPPIPSFGFPQEAPPQQAPGSAPTPAPAVVLALVALVGAALGRRRS